MDAPKDVTPEGWQAGAELKGDAGTVTTGPVTEPIKDWSQILLLWSLDPEHFAIKGAPTFKAWDGFAKEQSADGTSKIVSKRLFSYKAQVERVSADTRELEALAKSWRKKLLREPTRTHALEPLPAGGVAYVLPIADAQLGKKGTTEAVDNWRRGVLGHVERIRRLRASGWNIVLVVVAFMGDEHEGYANNYPNQPHTIELNFSAQLQLDFDLRVWTVKTVGDIGLPVEVLSVISNHGEYTRNGSKDVVTTKGDNSSTMIGRLVRKLFDELPAYAHVTWNIAGSNPDIVVDLCGVRASFSHGHIAKGRGATTEARTKNAIERQILGRTKELGDVQLYVVAHYHHFYSVDFEGRTLIGCPALEAERSSEWMLDQFGVWSPPGMVGFIAGSALGTRGYGEIHVI